MDGPFPISVEGVCRLLRGSDLHSQRHNGNQKNFCSHSGSRRLMRDKQRKSPAPPRGRRKVLVHPKIILQVPEKNVTPDCPRCLGASAAVRDGRSTSTEAVTTTCAAFGKTRLHLWKVFLHASTDKNAYQGHLDTSVPAAVGQQIK